MIAYLKGQEKQLEELLFIDWFLEREEEGEKERDIDLLFYLLMHPLVDSCICPDPITWVHRDNTLTNWSTQPGPQLEDNHNNKKPAYY